MKKLLVQIPSKASCHYPILIDQGMLQNAKVWSAIIKGYEHVIIITDHHTKKYYGQALFKYLKANDYPIQLLLSFPAGEKSKQQQTKQYLEEQMLKKCVTRNTLCLALGGGVVGDLAGFISATYMRGIDYIQIPTTLLAMVDSSVGGKTAIDTPFGKNLIGAFWQPKAVIADLNCLETLPQQHLINGLIEALKMFLTSDLASFKYTVKHLDQILQRDQKILSEIIHRAVKIKAAVVEKDEKEKDLRQILNFGHTIGHALEQVTDYKMLHGYAVGYGILVEAKIAEILGILNAEDNLKIQNTFAILGITGKKLQNIDVGELLQATQLDKKAKKNAVNYVLLQGIGKVYQPGNKFVHVVEDDVVKQAFSHASHMSFPRMRESKQKLMRGY